MQVMLVLQSLCVCCILQQTADGLTLITSSDSHDSRTVELSHMYVQAQLKGIGLKLAPLAIWFGSSAGPS